MKFWLGLSFLLLFFLGHSQEIEIRKAKVIRYNTDNGWLNSLTVDFGVDQKGYVYYCNQKFERFDGAVVEQVNISDQGYDEYFRVVNIDSIHFLLCNTDCYIFNTQTQANIKLTQKNSTLLIPYVFDEKYIKIVDLKYGEYLLDRSTRKIIQYDSVRIDLFYNQTFQFPIEKVCYAKAFYDEGSNEMHFFNDQYVQISSTRLNAKPINFTSDQNFILVLADQLLIYGKKGTLINSVDLPAGKHFIEFSDIKKFSKTEYLVNLQEGLFVFDIEEMKFTHEFRDIQNNPIIINDYFRNIIRHKETLHILAHFSGHYRLQFQKHEVNNFIIPEGNTFVKTLFADAKRNRVFLGNQFGEFFQFDSKGNFIQKINEINDQARSTGIVKTADNEYVLCTTKSCHKVTFSNDKAYDESIILSGNLGLYYSNTYTYNDTININGQIKVVQFPNKSCESIIVKSVPPNAFQIQMDNCIIYWHENSRFIMKKSSDKIDTIHVPVNLGGPICGKILDEKTLLVGSRKGLFTLNLNDLSIKDFTNIDDWIYAIEVYNDIYFCSTNQGIIIVKDGAIIKRITIADGINSNEFNTNTSYTAEDGSMYFGGVSGGISFYPETLLDNSSEKQTYPTSFKIDGNRTTTLINNRLTLAPEESNLNFRLSTLGNNPSLEFNDQYLIPKISRTWINVGKGNFINLTLSPGTYQVFYHSSTFFDPTAPLLDSFTISVKEFWYKSKWFYGIILLLLNIALLGFIVSYYRFRSILHIKKLEAKEKLNSEKMRISRDLHDNLGTQMAMVGRNIDWLNENINQLSKEVIKENLNSILEVSMDTNQSLRDSIWAFKQSTFTAKELADRTRHLIDRYRKLDLNITFDFTDDIQTNHPISPSISLNLIRIIQESITNAVKHAHCNIVRIMIHTDRDCLYLTVQDNGIGFNPKTVSKGQGLENIEDRAANIQAEIKIDSILEVGTKIELQLKI